MKKMVVYGIAVLAMSATPLVAQQTSGTSTTQGGTRSSASGSSMDMGTADRQFVMDAAHGGMAEVELSQIAKDKAQSAQVKQFAERMVTDHGKANDELKSLAQSKNIMLPTDLDASHKAAKDRLSELSGAQFDRAYMQQMVSDHEKVVSEFKKESQEGRDSEIKAWAAKTLPTLQEHLQMAQAANRGVVGTSGTRETTPGTTPETRPAPGSSTPQSPGASGGSTANPR